MASKLDNLSCDGACVVYDTEIPVDSPGVSEDVMLVNTDSFEECNEDLCTQYVDDLPHIPESPIKKVQEELKCQSSEQDLSQGLSSIALHVSETHDEETSSKADVLFDSDPDKNDSDDEYLQNDDWLSQENHIFILSESGKPIYSRHGKEDRLVTLFGLIQALVSFVADSDDILRCIKAGDQKFVFYIRTPLILVAVSKSSASFRQLSMQLSYIHNQIVCVLTSSALTKMFERHHNYDFRNLLGGTERILDNLVDLIDSHPSFLLGAVQCLTLQPSVRDSISQAIVSSCSKIKNLVFGLIVAGNQLVSLVRMKKFLPHPADLHLLFNLVSATESLKTSENWMPICLPKFDPNGYLYGHVSYLAEDCNACLILLTVDKEQFYLLSEARKKIVDKLLRQNCLEKITLSMQSSSISAREFGSSHLRHFLYKSKSTAQYICPSYTAPYHTKQFQKNLLSLYQLLHHRVHSSLRPLKMIYMTTERESLVGWVTKEFEVYGALEPLVTKDMAILAVNKLLKAIKSEENKLFILNSPTF